jgi:PAS domain S-box-containing protein
LPPQISRIPSVELPATDGRLASQCDRGVEPDRGATTTNEINDELAPAIANAGSVKFEAIFRSAIDACPFGIVVVEPIGKIVLANGEMERIFGYVQDELIGHTVDILVPANLRTQYARCHSQFATDPQLRQATNRRLTGRRKDGGEIPLEVRLSPIHTDNGILILGAVVDISERLRIERHKDEFVATVSHELRTPLTSISGALGLLINDKGKTLPRAALRLLTIAHNNSQRLVRLVNSILDMEKIESGKLVFALKRIAVRSLVEQAIEANRGFADNYGVRIRLDPAAAAVEMRVDPDWLTQVVTNLLSNAVKFSPRHTEVEVAVESRNGRVRISVRDHGHGVPEEFKGRIFEKFAQANASDARREGGTGLGLSIVKQIVTRLGGEVSFDDAPGGGAIFHVELPMAAAEADPPNTPSLPSATNPTYANE